MGNLGLTARPAQKPPTKCVLNVTARPADEDRTGTWQCDGFRVILQQSGRWWWRGSCGQSPTSIQSKKVPKGACPDISDLERATSTLFSCQEPRPEGPVKRLGSCFPSVKRKRGFAFWLTFLLLLCPCGSVEDIHCEVFMTRPALSLGITKLASVGSHRKTSVFWNVEAPVHFLKPSLMPNLICDGLLNAWDPQQGDSDSKMSSCFQATVKGTPLLYLFLFFSFLF